MRQVVLHPKMWLPPVLCDVLPARLLDEMVEVLPEGALPEEIRLRRGRCASVTLRGKNLRLATVLSPAEMDALLPAFCEGSLYAHGETVCRGYLTLAGGVRVGLCGQAAATDGRVTGVRDISSYSIRIPRSAGGAGAEICELLRSFAFTRGVLIFSPPGVGKTTLLRATAARLAGGAASLRVAVIDTRGELSFAPDDPALLLDILSGYPRKAGLSIAVRSLAAEVIVCDEIGDFDEAREILNVHGAGVPLLASAHAADARELLARPGMRLLHEARCFGAYVGISRASEDFEFVYDVTTWEAADALF